MSMRLSLCVLSLSSLLITVAGCGADGPELAYVSGTVTLDGKPCQNVMVQFVPQAPNASPSSGQTDMEGHYTLRFTRDKEGAMLGMNDVDIIAPPPITPTEIAQYKAKNMPIPEAVTIPEKYETRGSLTADVQPGDNTFDFPLTSK